MKAKELVELVHARGFETLWSLLAEALERYFRVSIEGLEHVPTEGPVIVVPNHSGFAGADVVVLSHILTKRTNRHFRVLAHRAYFDVFDVVKMLSKSFYLRLASTQSGMETLRHGNGLIVFPEGESGNFKSSFKAYQLQPFHTGFVRLAVLSKAPVVPAIVIGAEESHFNLGSVDFSWLIKGYRIPFPVNIIPLPAKWRIRFLAPIDTSKLDLTRMSDKAYLEDFVEEIRRGIQREVDEAVQNRPYVYF